jgi:hypothetical protein
MQQAEVAEQWAETEQTCAAAAEADSPACRLNWQGYEERSTRNSDAAHGRGACDWLDVPLGGC